MGVVTLPRWMLVALVAALAVALLVVAFLLGRASSIPDEQVPPPHPARLRVGAAPAPQPAPTVGWEQAPEVFTATPAQPSGPVRSIVVEPSPAPEPNPGTERPSDVTAAGRVAVYLARIDGIQGAGGQTGGGDGAQRILTATLQGDTSELDRLIAETERTRRELGTVQPPAECSTYHATLLRLMGDSHSILQDLRGALAGEDSNRLATLAGRATALQTSAEELKAMEQELRRRYALPKP